MKCSSRIIVRGMLVPCGQCMPCRFNRRRVWTHRLMLEASQHEHSSFITLTYDNEHLPLSESGLPTLVPADLRNFMKRFRHGSVSKLRYYAVGEYGDTTQRPHYHLAVFGYPVCLAGRTVLDRATSAPTCCPVCRLVWKSWSKGGIYLGSLTRDSAQYVAGYVTKKMTSRDDYRLGDRYPEFSRMSNRGGLGLRALDPVIDTLKSYHLDKVLEDVPASLAHGGKILPLGRYLRAKLRKGVFGHEDTPQFVLENLRQELQDLHVLAENASQSSSRSFREELKDLISNPDPEFRLYLKSQRGEKNETL